MQHGSQWPILQRITSGGDAGFRSCAWSPADSPCRQLQPALAHGPQGLPALSGTAQPALPHQPRRKHSPPMRDAALLVRACAAFFSRCQARERLVLPWSSRSACSKSQASMHLHWLACSAWQRRCLRSTGWSGLAAPTFRIARHAVRWHCGVWDCVTRCTGYVCVLLLCKARLS